jgi:exodeoxyribonuclease V alpha subunit
MLYKKLVYTAVTRAKENLTIIGDERAFVMAINNNYEIERKTMLKERLLDFMNNN